MSKLKNSVKKGTLWSVIVVIIIALGIVLSAFFGLNMHSSLQDTKTLTVSMNKTAFSSQLEIIEKDCEQEIGDLKVLNVIKSELGGDECEIVYVFNSNVDLTNVEKALKDNFAAKTADGAELAGSFINVSSAKEEVQVILSKSFVLRTTIAIVVMAVLAFAYVAIRHSLGMGIAAAASVIAGAGLTFAIGVCTRIPATSSYAYAIALGGLISLVASLLTLNKVHANLSEEEAVDETVAKSVPVKEIAWLVILISAAMLLVAVVSIIGAGAFTVAAWFAVACIVAMAVAAFVGIIYTPALYVILKGAVDKNLGSNAKSEYVGAKKTSTKIKKLFAKKEAVEEKTEEAPACCSCDCDKCEKTEEAAEEVVEEAVEAEEAAEEVAEEAVEAEEVVEEAAEEVVEEAVETEEVEEEVVEETAEEATEEVESEENND